MIYNNNLWATGILFDNYSKEEKEYKIISMGHFWLNSILELQSNVYKDINDKDLYVQLTKEELIETLTETELCLGIIVNDELIAFRISSHGDDETKELAEYCNIYDTDRVIFIEATAVLKRYRGNNLQRIMINLTMDHLKKENKYDFALSTVSPRNIPSVKSLLSNDFEIIYLARRYGGKLRYICQYKFNEGKDKLSGSKSNDILIKYNEYDLIGKTLNEGYSGVGILFKNNEDYVKLISTEIS
jgi:hypothetical protein